VGIFAHLTCDAIAAGCCCEALLATNFIPYIDIKICDGCGNCVILCPVEAMALVSVNDPYYPARKKARVDKNTCLGCGVCLTGCHRKALKLISREKQIITPVDSVHRVVMMAIERGKLQNLIFDNQALLSHRAMAAILGAILKLPPIKQMMASQQFKSRYLESLIRRHNTQSG
jgi:ferredoxin